MELRPYQQQAVSAVYEKWAEFNKLLLVAPTGSGKTIMFSAIAKRGLETDGGRSLILAHREELIDQAIAKLYAATGLLAAKEQAEYRASRSAPVVVASVQTLRGERLAGWPAKHFDRLIIDEAHHVLADSYQGIAEHFASCKVLGVTATPDRGDKRNLGRYFEDIACEITLVELIKARHLCPIRVATIPLSIDLSAVRTVAGDYQADDLANALEPWLEEIVRMLATHYPERKTLVFLPLIAISQQFTRLCQKVGLPAEHIDGNSQDRKAILERFRTGQTTLLSNAMLLSEGYDEPSIDCVVCLRPTRIRSLYAQIVGRGTRVAPGKTELLLLDFLWKSAEHDLIRPAHLIAQSDTEAKGITRALGSDGDLLEAQEHYNQAALRRKALLRERLKEQTHKAGREFDAMEFALSLSNLRLAEYEPTMYWHAESVSEKQALLLTRYGINRASVKSRGHASAIIEMIIKRAKLGLATPKQLLHLKRNGYPKPELATRQEASAFLERLWQKPVRS